MMRYLAFSLLCICSLAGATTLETSIERTAYSSGERAHPVGRWVSADELDISFIDHYGDFQTIDPASLRYELDGDLIKLYYKIAEIPHAPDAPVALCYSTRLLVFKLKGFPHKAYSAQVMAPDAPGAKPLPVIPAGAHPDIPDVLKIASLDKGATLRLNGKPATKAEVEAAVERAYPYQTPVWFYSDEGFGTGELFDFVADHRLPIVPADKPDFSGMEAKLADIASGKE